MLLWDYNAEKTTKNNFSNLSFDRFYHACDIISSVFFVIDSWHLYWGEISFPPAGSGELDKMDSRGPFQFQPFFDSMKIHFYNAEKAIE